MACGSEVDSACDVDSWWDRCDSSCDVFGGDVRLVKEAHVERSSVISAAPGACSDMLQDLP